VGVAPPPDQPEGPPPPTGPPVEPGPDLCPRCGAPHEPYQEYCLECGLRLPATTGFVGRAAVAWRRRAPYPGDWIWPVLLGLVVAGLATAAVILLTRDDNNGTKPTLVATPQTGTGTVTPPPASTTGGGTETTAAPPPATPTPPPTETTPPPPPPPPPATLTPWPGTNGYTVVLNSIPTSAGHAAAVVEAKKALAKGLQTVGVLNSSDYSSLHPGYYVVFSGTYTTLGEATQGAASARSSGSAL